MAAKHAPPLEHYRCPRCLGRLENLPGNNGIGCGTHRFALVDGVPDFVDEANLAPLASQVIDSFAAEWGAWKEYPPAYMEFQKGWLLTKLGLNGTEGLKDLLDSHKAVLDAGTGVGYKLQLMAQASSKISIHGIDASWSVLDAARNTAGLSNVSVARADIFHLPYKPGQFDLIVCDGVLHHTGDTRKAFAALAALLAPGGDIFIHVYRKMGPVREFTGELIRRTATKLTNAEALEFCKPFTALGRSLAESGVEVDVPEDIPVLDIKKGRHNLQRLIYYTMLQCHWNPLLTFEQNNLINFDCYHPVHATTHTEEEALGWFAENGLRDARIISSNVKGVSVHGRR